MKKHMLIKTISFITLIVFGLILSSCSNENINELEQIKNRRKIVLGTSADYPPYEFVNVINGNREFVGFDIAIAKEIAKDLGVELEIKDMAFGGLLAALDSGNVDFVLAGMTPSAERAKNVDFSKIYYVAEQAVVVRTENKDTLTSIESLKGKRIGVQKGTIQADLANEIEGATVKELGRITDIMLELKEKKIDAVILEKPVAVSYVDNNTDLFLSNINFDEVDGGSAVAVKKNSPELLEALNKTIDRLIENKLIDQFVTEATNLVDAE